MPLLYGEGRKAFLRLQEEIIKRSTDQSILAWGTTINWDDPVLIDRHGMLAKSPRYFNHLDGEGTGMNVSDKTYSITNNGLEMRAKLIEGIFPESHGDISRRLLLKLTYGRGSGGLRVVHVSLVKLTPQTYERAFAGLYEIKLYQKRPAVKWNELDEQVIYLRTGLELVKGKEWDYDGYEQFDVSD